MNVRDSVGRMIGRQLSAGRAQRLRKTAVALRDKSNRRRDIKELRRSERRYVPRPFLFSYLVLLVVGILAGALVFTLILGIQSLPLSSTTFDTAQASARLEALKVALTTTGGIAVLAGLYVNYRKQRNEESNSVREQDRVFTERFGNAAELLGNQSAATKLSAVNALARLADDSPRDRNMCLSTLCAYLRLPVKLVQRGTGDSRSDKERTCDRSEWLDPDEWEVRRTALAIIIARVLKAEQRHKWEPDRLDLDGATLVDLELRGAETAVEFSLLNCIVVGEHVRIGSITFNSNFALLMSHVSVGMYVGDAVFNDRCYFFGSRFTDEVMFNNVRWGQHLSCSAIVAEGRFFIKNSIIDGYMTFAGAAWGARASIELVSGSRLDSSLGQDVDPGTVTATLDLRRATVAEGLRIILDPAGKSWILLQESDVVGRVQTQGERLDLSGADLSRAVFDDRDFRPLEVARDDKTVLPDSPRALTVVAAPRLPPDPDADLWE